MRIQKETTGLCSVTWAVLFSINGGGAQVLNVHEWAQHTCDFQIRYLYFREEEEGLIHKKSTFPKLLVFFRWSYNPIYFLLM